jgi:hypothetical protein
MASAAVTAASAAATLVPFEMSSFFLAGEGRLEELFDRMARRVAILDGHNLLGHCSCFTAKSADVLAERTESRSTKRRCLD